MSICHFCGCSQLIVTPLQLVYFGLMSRFSDVQFGKQVFVRRNQRSKKKYIYIFHDNCIALLDTKNIKKKCYDVLGACNDFRIHTETLKFPFPKVSCIHYHAKRINLINATHVMHLTSFRNLGKILR